MSTFNNISELSFVQISMVSGGQPTQEEMRRQLGPCCITSISMHGEYVSENCLIPISCGEFCFTTCIPEKKPEKCSYQSWGLLHDLEPGIIQKCAEIRQDKVGV